MQRILSVWFPDLIWEGQNTGPALLKLAHWAERFSPWVMVDGRDGLLIEISAVAHLFGGEAMLVADIRQRLSAFGFPVKTSLAPFIGAAWALARFSPQESSGPDIRASLALLPIEALRISPETASALRQQGMETIGQLYEAQPLEAHVSLRLDQALGLVDEVFAPLEPPPAAHVRLLLTSPLQGVESLDAAVTDCIHRLCRKLVRAGQGATHIRLKAFRLDGTREVLNLEVSKPSHDPLHILGGLRPQLQTLQMQSGMDGLIVEAVEIGATESEEPGFMENVVPFRYDFHAP